MIYYKLVLTKALKILKNLSQPKKGEIHKIRFKQLIKHDNLLKKCKKKTTN